MPILFFSPALLSKFILTELSHQKNGPKSVGKSCGGWTTKLHLIAPSDECAVIFSLSHRQAEDVPEGRRLLTEIGAVSESCAMIMDRAYEGDKTRKLVFELGFSPVVPPKSSRIEPWKCHVHRVYHLCPDRDCN